MTHESTRHPKEILQETQLVEYTGNLYLSSPYSVTKRTTNVLLPSRNVKSYTKTKPVRKVTTFSHGPLQKNSPFQQGELNMHFKNNNKFLTVTRLQRVIELLYSQK